MCVIDGCLVFDHRKVQSAAHMSFLGELGNTMDDLLLIHTHEYKECACVSVIGIHSDE